MTDYISRADAVSREDYHNLLTASEDIDRALREYQAKEEQLSAEVAPKIDHDRDWIIGCILHDRPVDDTDYCAWGEESEAKE